jgi:hypothetical protein
VTSRRRRTPARSPSAPSRSRREGVSTAVCDKRLRTSRNASGKPGGPALVVLRRGRSPAMRCRVPLGVMSVRSRTSRRARASSTARPDRTVAPGMWWARETSASARATRWSVPARSIPAPEPAPAPPSSPASGAGARSECWDHRCGRRSLPASAPASACSTTSVPDPEADARRPPHAEKTIGNSMAEVISARRVTDDSDTGRSARAPPAALTAVRRGPGSGSGGHAAGRLSPSRSRGASRGGSAGRPRCPATCR